MIMSLVYGYGSTTVTAVQLAVCLIEITMQLTAFIFCQLVARPLPLRLRKRLRIARITNLPSVLSAIATFGAAVILIL